MNRSRLTPARAVSTLAPGRALGTSATLLVAWGGMGTLGCADGTQTTTSQDVDITDVEDEEVEFDRRTFGCGISFDACSGPLCPYDDCRVACVTDGDPDGSCQQRCDDALAADPVATQIHEELDACKIAAGCHELEHEEARPCALINCCDENIAAYN